MLKESRNGNLEYHKLPKEEMERRGILGRLVGICADFVNPTRNGRLYPESLWEKVFDSDIMKEKIANKVCYGELGHPADREETDMEKVAVCLAEQPIKGPDGKLRAVFDILNTKNGQILKTLCDYGSTLGISSRGSGDLVTDYEGNESVDPDTYNCEGFDVVLVPAIKEARLQYVNEALDKKRYNKTLKQALTESLNKANEADRKIMEESLNTIGIKLNESTLVTKSDSLQGEEEYEILDSGYDSLSEKKLYKIMGKDGKERWIPESDAKFVIDKGFEPAPEVEEPVEEPIEAPAEEPVIEEAVVEESSSQDMADVFKQWADANPDVDIKFLLDEYNGNIGSILYNEASYNKFVDWAKNEHSVNINSIPRDTSFEDEMDFNVSDEAPVEEPAEEQVDEVPAEEPEEATEALNEEGVQLADVNIGAIQNSEAVLTEADEEEDNSFYINETPYGFTEITYKGRVITVDGDQITVDIDGDEAIMNSLEEAQEEIDKLDLDPDYHIEHWHDEGDTKVADLDGVKTALGLNESMYVKKKGDYKKVEEAKEEKAEKIDEALIEGAAEENAMAELKDNVIDYIVELINDSGFEDNLAYEVASKFNQYNPDWCGEDVDSFASRTVEQYKRTLANGEANVLFENAPRELGEELSKETGEDADYYRSEVDLLLDNMLTLAKGASTDGARRLSQLIQRAMDVIESGLEDDRLQESVEDGSDIEGDNVTSDEAVAGLKEALKKAKKLEKDNLSLQEKLSASNARESQLEEELGRYKKATISLSKSAKETKTLKESLNKKDKESKDLTEKLTSATSKVNELSKTAEDNKKLTEQLEQLTTKNDETLKQLNESKELVEKYRRSYKSLKESFVEAKAQYYGVSKDAALKKLGESYKVSDVDKSLRELGQTKRNMKKLPVDLNESVKLSKASLTVKTNERSLDDTSLDSLLSLLD